MLKRTLACTALALTATIVITSHAQQDTPTPAEQAAAATETRQAVFKLIGYNMGAISGMARGRVEFDAKTAERNARRIADLAPMIPELFARMDTRGFDVDTKALDVIWEEPAEFESRAMDLVEAANKFADIAAQGDRMQTISSVRDFGSTCGNCHDNFRVDDD